MFKPILSISLHAELFTQKLSFAAKIVLENDHFEMHRSGEKFYSCLAQRWNYRIITNELSIGSTD